MGRLVVVTGGARSGKSGFALRLAEAHAGPRLFVATCPCLDEESGLRIRRHQQERQCGAWETVEEERDLAAVLSRRSEGVVLVDCLTLWVNNLLHVNHELGEDDIAPAAAAVLEAIGTGAATVICVTNEVGWGIVPETPMGRRFRDLSGRMNQIFCAGADECWLVVAGRALRLEEQHP